MKKKMELDLLHQLDFHILEKFFLVRFIKFNARRGAEASKIKLKQWVDYEKWKRNGDVNSKEDPMERLLAQRLKLTYSKG